MLIRSVRLTIELENGQKVQAILSNEGFQQWGNTRETLGETVEAVEAMRDAAADWFEA